MPTILRQVLRKTFWRLRVSRKSLGVCLGVRGYSRKSLGVCLGVRGYSRKSRGVCLGVCGSPASLAANALAFAGVPRGISKDTLAVTTLYQRHSPGIKIPHSFVELTLSNAPTRCPADRACTYLLAYVTKETGGRPNVSDGLPWFCSVVLLGLEPRISGPESDVLPLHHRTMSLRSFRGFLPFAIAAANIHLFSTPPKNGPKKIAISLARLTEKTNYGSNKNAGKCHSQRASRKERTQHRDR